MPSSPGPLATPYLDPAFVAAVVALPDPLERNAAITRGYHELSEAVVALLGRERDPALFDLPPGTPEMVDTITV